MRILWHSVAPWIKTGYGSQTEIFTKRIRDQLGHDLAISTWTMRGGMMDYNGFRIYPGHLDNFGNDIVAEHGKHWGAELVITLTDSWVFKNDAMKKIPWAPWTPIDHDPVPPKVQESLKFGYAAPIAYTRFGEQKMREAGLAPLYAPHGAHEGFFERTTRAQARKRLGFPKDAFIVGMVGVNQGAPSRKSYPQCIEAFQRFHQRHRDTFLYMHTRKQSEQGLNLEQLIQYLGLEPDCYRFPDAYQYLLNYPETYLRDVYTAIDVLLAPFMGEGFGIPIIEAQACGAPVIVTNFSAMPELCHFGEMIEAPKFYTNQASFQRLPQVEDIVKALNRVYGYSEAKLKAGRRKARAGIKAEYHPDIVTGKYWGPVLQQARERIGDWDYDDKAANK